MVRRNRSILVLLLLLLAAAALGQQGPDNDPAAAQGYVNSVFRFNGVDSVNEFNGQLTVPIPIGPDFPIGPALKFQARLVYGSKVWDYGNPTDENEPNSKPIVGDPGLGLGWTFTPGKINPCGPPGFGRLCYYTSDGAEIVFEEDDASPGYFYTGDASQWRLHRSGPSGPYTLWDGDGNEYTFDWQVSGYDDNPTQNPGYIRDYGRGRDGWYLREIEDRFGNKLKVTYHNNLGSLPCPFVCSGPSAMGCTGSTNSWIPKYFDAKPVGATADQRFGEVILNPNTKLIETLRFKVLRAGSLLDADWGLVYSNLTYTAGGATNCSTTTLKTLTALNLPADIAGASDYGFTYHTSWGNGLLKTMTLPTSATIRYDYGYYHFYSARRAALQELSECNPTPPPVGQMVRKSSVFTDGSREAPEDRPADTPCLPGVDSRLWEQVQAGVLRRTVSGAGLTTAITDYTQYSFPRGEMGGTGDPPQTLTVVVHPTDVDGRRRAETTLFYASSIDLDDPPQPGSRMGAAIRHAVYEADPNATEAPFTPPTPVCPTSDAPALCVKNAVRVTQTIFEYGTASLSDGPNRRVQTETTYYGNVTNADPAASDYCPTCEKHTVSYSPGTTWEANGRHYTTETHTGTLGGDARTNTTTWTPQSTVWLRNLYSQRKELDTAIPAPLTEIDRRNELDRHPYFDLTTGFLKGDMVWDAASHRYLGTCRYADAAGNAAAEVSVSVGGPFLGAFPSPHPCSYRPDLPSWDSGVIGVNDDAFGKQHSYVSGLVTSTAWLTNQTPLSWKAYDVDRDNAAPIDTTKTGWISASRGTDGLATTYRYDSLGRVTLITPPSGLAATTISYPSPLKTSVTRGDTLQEYHYDGLGRLIREIRKMPVNYAVRTYTYDADGHQTAASEWGACTTLAGTCLTTLPPSSTSSDFEPFGRPRLLRGPDGAKTTISYADGSLTYSDTKKTVSVQNVNGTCMAGTCSGGTTSTTVSEYDAFGRLTKVTEPGGDVTAHLYDVAGKLTKVTMDTQIRDFRYDAFGFLIWEDTPEKDIVDYRVDVTQGGQAIKISNYGSLGNLRGKKEGSPAIANAFAYDAAARLETATAAGKLYLTNTYDDNTGCPFGALANCGRGKLTRQVAINPLFVPLHPTVATPETIQEDYSHGGLGGRLSRKTTRMPRGAVDRAVETWTYNSLGLASVHQHPRVRNYTLTASRGALQETITYSAGLPTTISLSGTDYDNTAVAGATISATYRPAGNLASYTASQNGGKSISTTIEQNGAGGLPRPSRISTNLGVSTIFDTGTYAYDGAGNVTGIGSDVFKYDARSRLISAKYSGQSTTCSDSGGNTLRNQCFGYDRWANLTGVTGVNARSLATSTSTNRLTGGMYDTRGNLKIFSTDTMTWDDINRMIREVRPGGIDWQYLYNGGDERTIRQTASSSGAAATRRDIARFITQAKIQAGQWTLTGRTCGEGALGFSDVHCTDPDWDYIQTFKEKKITAGCGSGQYCPNTALPREQMAVLLLRAKYGSSYDPPACTGIFGDVPCPSTYADWIEDLANKGITAGCGGGNFCPTQSVAELEMAIFLNKPVMWPSYHGIPGGSTYTLRDQENRLVTEFADSFAARDNIFLGNLVVASYLAKQPGVTPAWHFHVSDHLGSMRLAVKGSDGATVESHKYWPYGDEVGAAPASQRLAFAAMERDTEANHFYDHARTHNFHVGRFTSPDLLTGENEDPQSWNRYAYAGNNPLAYVDKNGLQKAWAQTAGEFLTMRAEEAASRLGNGQDTRPHEIVSDVVAMFALGRLGDDLTLGTETGLALGEGTGPGEALSSDVGRLSELGALLSFGGALIRTATSPMIFRVWGDEGPGFAPGAKGSGPFGPSWTTIDPRTMPSYRDAAGLPRQNTGRFVSEGKLVDRRGVTKTKASPLAGNKGGLVEVKVPKPNKQIKLVRVAGVNPPF